MTFADLVAGDSIFVDANTFVYQFSADPILGPPCNQLLQRIENQDLLVSPPFICWPKSPTR